MINGMEHCKVSQSRESCERVFLSLYSGTAKVSHVFHTKDAHTTTISIDVIEDGRNGLTRLGLQKAIEKQISNGFADVVAGSSNLGKGSVFLPGMTVPPLPPRDPPIPPSGGRTDRNTS